MALEESPGTRGSFEKKDAPKSATPEAPQVAEAAPAVDPEKIALQERLRQHEAALQEVAQMVQSGKLRLAEEKKPEAVEEDDSALIDRKELKKLKQELIDGVGQAFNQTTALTANQLRQAQVELLRPKLKNYEKYEKEIEDLLGKMDPRQAAQPNVIKQVYQVVRSQHLDEEIEAELANRLPQTEDEGDSWGEEAPMEVAPVQREKTRPAQHLGGVAPSGDAMATRPVQRTRQANTPNLSREEREIAQIFGIKSAEEWKKYGDPSWKPDLTGFKGRQRV